MKLGGSSMIGKMLKYMRNSKKLKQSELAKQLNIAQTTLSGYETHYSNPDFAMIEKIANICGFEILFKNKETEQLLKLNDLMRKDV